MAKTIITEEMIREVSKMLKAGFKIYEISDRLKISRSTLYKLRTDSRYEHIRNKYNEVTFIKKKLSVEEVDNICKMLEDGYSNAYVAETSSVSFNNVNRIRKGLIHKATREKYDIDISYHKSLKDETVHRICSLLEQGYSNIDISVAVKIDKDLISDIRDGTSYREISTLYNIEKVYRRSKVTDSVMEDICKMRRDNVHIDIICETLGIGKTAVYRSLKIEKFKHIRDKYGL